MWCGAGWEAPWTTNELETRFCSASLSRPCQRHTVTMRKMYLGPQLLPRGHLIPHLINSLWCSCFWLKVSGIEIQDGKHRLSNWCRHLTPVYPIFVFSAQPFRHTTAFMSSQPENSVRYICMSAEFPIY